MPLLAGNLIFVVSPCMHKYVICMLTYMHICMYFKLVNQHKDTFVSISVPSPRDAGTLSWFLI